MWVVAVATECLCQAMFPMKFFEYLAAGLLLWRHRLMRCRILARSLGCASPIRINFLVLWVALMERGRPLKCALRWPQNTYAARMDRMMQALLDEFVLSDPSEPRVSVLTVCMNVAASQADARYLAASSQHDEHLILD